MSAPASSAATKAQAPVDQRPLNHLAHPKDAGEADPENLQSFEQALRSAAGRQISVVDSGTTAIPMWTRQRLPRNTPAPPRPERPERPGTDRSAKRPATATRSDRRDDNARTETRHRPDNRVRRGDEERPTGRADRPDDDNGDDVADEGQTTASGEADTTEETADGTQAVSSDEQGEEASADNGISVEEISLLVVSTLATEVAAPTEATAEQGDRGAPELVAGTATVESTGRDQSDASTTVVIGQGDTDLVQAVDDTAAGDGADPLDTGPDVTAGTTEQAAGGDEASTAGDGRSGDRSSRDSDDLAGEAGPDPRVRAEATGPANQQLLVTDGSQPSPVATNKLSSGDATTAVTGLERAGGRTQQTGRPGAEAAAETSRSDESVDADGPDALWRQVRRALGNLRTRANGDQEMVLRLRPAELGSITVRINTNEAGMNVALVADSAAAASQLSQQRHHLLSDLDESGIGATTVDIGQHDLSGQSDGGQGSDRSSDNRPSVGTGQAGGSATGRRSDDGGGRRRATGTVDIDL